MKKKFLILFIYINFCIYFYNYINIILLLSIISLLIILFKNYEDKLIFQLLVTSIIKLNLGINTFIYNLMNIISFA